MQILINEKKKKKTRKVDLSLSKFSSNIYSRVCLNLSFTNLTDIPFTLTSLYNLKILNLDNNQISFIPIELFKLPLKELHLSNNQIKKLPLELGQLSNLKVLNLQFNRLKNLPFTIGNLLNLEILNINHNYLTELPDNMINMDNLKILYANDNYLTFPIFLFRMERLKELYIDLVFDCTIPTNFTFIKNANLKKLSITAFSGSETALSGTGTALSGTETFINDLFYYITFPKLNELYLIGNNMNEIPNGIFNNKNIKLLQLDDNNISVIPSNIIKLKKLSKIYINNMVV